MTAYRAVVALYQRQMPATGHNRPGGTEAHQQRGGNGYDWDAVDAGNTVSSRITLTVVNVITAIP